jgi:thiamine-monophosphate kinase
MKIADLGEFAFIDRISPPFTQKLPPYLTGIGDDCAVLPLQNEQCLLVTTDMLIEDSHFLRSEISPYDLGYKSLAVNLSDIAAMGGIPKSAYLSLGIPSEIEVSWMDQFYDGLYNLAREFDVQLLGGDTTRSGKHLIINFAVLGVADKPSIKYRSNAQEGDILCLTGYIGDSGGGLRILLDKLERNEIHQYLVIQHHRPRPHVEEGIWLAHQAGVHAMIDVSDGIDSDLKRIMERSECGVEVYLEQLPISEQLRRAAQLNGWNAPEMAATGGEDYCLLASVEKKAYSHIAEGFKGKFNRPLFKFGSIISAHHNLKYLNHGRPVILGKHGFDHFAGE